MVQALPAAPNPLTIQYLRDCIAALRAPLVTASKIDPLLAALHAKTDHANFGIRYMLAAGLPLIVQSAKKEEEISILALQPRLSDALKSLAAIHWKKPAPAAVTAAIAGLNPTGMGTTDTHGVPTDDAARIAQLSLLTIDHKNSQLTINPEDEFASLIARVP
jgi:hypothetical protein